MSRFVPGWRMALAGALCAFAAVAVAAEPVKLRLIGINDFHGNLEPAALTLALADPQATAPDAKPLFVPAGGAPALAGLVRALREGAPNSLLVSAGDMIGAAPLVSTLFRHESTIEVMNAIGVDAHAVGNHEFDAGFTELLRVAKGGCASNAPDAPVTSCAKSAYAGAKFPFLAANVVDREGLTPLAASVVLRVEGVRVGIIGAVTRTTPSIVIPSGVAGLKFLDEARAINREAKRLLAQGVRTIIVVIHEGGELGAPNARGDWNDASCPDAHGPIFDIARKLDPAIRVLFTGHTHQGYRCVVDGRTLIQGTSYGRGLSVVDVELDRRTGRLLPASVRSINLPVVNERTDPALRDRIAASLPAPYAEVLQRTRPDPAVAELVAGFSALAAPKAQRPVGQVGGTFRRGGTVDSAAGRLIADAQLAATREPARGGAQIAFMNPGGIRSDLECTGGTPPCTVTFGQVFTMQPFGNSLVVMTLTGAQIRQLLEEQQRRPGAEPTLLQPSEGITYTWRGDAPSGERVTDLRLNGVPVEPDRKYRVTVNSFLAEGGDGFTVLKHGMERTGGAQDLDAMLDYLKPPEVRSPIAQPRITRQP